jgi:hypothetical protein
LIEILWQHTQFLLVLQDDQPTPKIRNPLLAGSVLAIQIGSLLQSRNLHPGSYAQVFVGRLSSLLRL